MRMLSWTHRVEDESGAALIEFALVLPVLLLLLLGMLDFGKAINYWNDESHLVGSGARWAVVNRNPGSPSLTLQKYIQQQADTSELKNGGTGAVQNPAKVCIDFPNGTAAIGDPVRVRVTVTYKWLGFLGQRLPRPDTTIGQSSTMRLEQTPTTYSLGGGGTGTCP